MSVSTVNLYTDAEGNGGVGAVADLDGMIVFLRGNIPVCVRQMLHKRRTNIVAYELLAGVVGLLSLCPERLRGKRVIHYIDNTAAMACIVRYRILATADDGLWDHGGPLVICTHRIAWPPS